MTHLKPSHGHRLSIKFELVVSLENDGSESREVTTNNYKRRDVMSISGELAQLPLNMMLMRRGESKPESRDRAIVPSDSNSRAPIGASPRAPFFKAICSCITTRLKYSTGLVFLFTVLLSQSALGLSFVEVQRDGVGGVVGLDYPVTVTVSPDGAHVYVGSNRAVAVFARDGGTGRLRFVEALMNDVLRQPRTVNVSPDGAHVYIVSQIDNVVAVFARNQTTGRLRLVEVLMDGIGGVDGLDLATSLAVSPDGAHVYVASYRDDAVAVFARNRTTGRLRFIEVLKQGIGGVEGLHDATSITLSPDGKHVYVASRGDRAVAVFGRDEGSGRLRFVEVLRDRVGDVDGLTHAELVTVSPDGAHVYVASGYKKSVAVFSRDKVTGRLSFIDVHEFVNGYYNPYSIAVSPNGAHVYIPVFERNAVANLERNSATGQLEILVGVGGVEDYRGSAAVAVSPDSEHVYAVSPGDDALAVLQVDVSEPVGDPSILAGTWHLGFFWDSPAPTRNDLYFDKIEMPVDENGDVGTGNWEDSYGESGTITGDSLSISTTGLVSGILTYTDGVSGGSEALSDFAVTPDGQLLAGVASVRPQAGDEGFVGLGTKTGTGYTNNDLVGTWYLYNFWDEEAPSSGDAGWSRGTFQVNSAGNITSGSVTEPGAGPATAITGGRMWIDNKGVVTLQLNWRELSGESGISILEDLRMNQSKQVVQGVDEVDNECCDFPVLIKGGGSFATSDMQGKWYVYGYNDESEGHRPTWYRGEVTVDASGDVTKGLFKASDEANSATVTSGQMTLDPAGLLSYNLNWSDGDSRQSELYKLNANKNFAVGVDGTKVGDEVSITLMIKAAEIEAIGPDTDGDGIRDASDNCPSVGNADQANNDKDSLGDACDPDDDNDGVPDTSDKFPFDASESVDTDGDGIGNNADIDDDNDGLSDQDEARWGSDPLIMDTDGDGLSDGAEVAVGRVPTVDEPAVLGVINLLLSEP